MRPIMDVQLHSTSSELNSFIYTFKQPRHQNFCFRLPVIKYILKNPTGKVWKKLIKTCKYFFLKYPFYPIEKMKRCYRYWDADGKIIYLAKAIPEMWIFNSFDCSNFSVEPNFVSKIISKIVKNELQIFRISYQYLTWKDYQILTSSGTIKEIRFSNSSIKYSDGKDVTIDMLLENLGNVENFSFYHVSGSKTFEKNAVQKMSQILSGLKNLRYFELSFLDETFDLSAFIDFLMKNEMIVFDLRYVFGLQFSEAFKEMLETCFGKLVADPPKTIPKIIVYGFCCTQYREYCKIRHSRD